MPNIPSKSALRGLRAIVRQLEEHGFGATGDVKPPLTADQHDAMWWLRTAIEEGEIVRRVDDKLDRLLRAERLEPRLCAVCLLPEHAHDGREEHRFR